MNCTNKKREYHKVLTIAHQLRKYGAEKIILDSVMVAQSGEKLLQDDALQAIRQYADKNYF